MSDPKATYEFGFEYDDGFGRQYVASATVEIHWDAAECEFFPLAVALDVDGQHGGEAPDRVIVCCNEMAEEIAWEKWKETIIQEDLQHKMGARA